MECKSAAIKQFPAFSAVRTAIILSAVPEKPQYLSKPICFFIFRAADLKVQTIAESIM